MALFDKALIELGVGQTLDPRSFAEYAKSSGFPTAKTAEAISVQSFRDLAPELRNAGVMCFRLGRKPGAKGTHFALARHTGSWSDYFFLDGEIFSKCQCKNIEVNRESLRIFEILPKSTETSLVNLAVSSGILTTALKLDSKSHLLVNATAQGTYSFTVRPHQDLSAAWPHDSGQVEIDGAFVAKRGGVETVFVVEAKVSRNFGSLSKHKIAYPMLSLMTSTPNNIPVIGIYLRVLRKASGLEFYIAESRFSSERNEVASLLTTNTDAYYFGK